MTSKGHAAVRQVPYNKTLNPILQPPKRDQDDARTGTGEAAGGGVGGCKRTGLLYEASNCKHLRLIVSGCIASRLFVAAADITYIIIYL